MVSESNRNFSEKGFGFLSMGVGGVLRGFVQGCGVVLSGDTGDVVKISAGRVRWMQDRRLGNRLLSHWSGLRSRRCLRGQW